jgi:hypothetical protein
MDVTARTSWLAVTPPSGRGQTWFRASWSYAAFPSVRQRHLGADCPPYSEIILQLGEAMQHADIVFQIDKGFLIPVDDALRPLLYVDVDMDLVDWLFNGASGYRAQYYKSPENGLQANAYAFAKLEHLLLVAAHRADFSYQHPDHGLLTLAEADFLTSLRLPSAKIWGDETTGELQNVINLNVESWPDIYAHRWLENAERGNDKAKKGAKAPRFTTLKFHGAFLKNGQEVILPDKLTRSADIYSFGFS